MEQQAVVRVLTVKGLKAQKIEMELTSLYGDEGLQINVVEKWRTRFLQERREFGDCRRSRRPAYSDLKQMIADFIRERHFLSCKLLSTHVKVSKETYRRIHQAKVGLKRFHFRWVLQALTPNMKASRTAMSYQPFEILQYCQATDFANFLAGDQSSFFLECPPYDMAYGPHPEIRYRKHP
jgi:hypothetical protein